MPAQWIAQSGVQERSQRLCYLLKAESLMQWLNLNVLTALNGPGEMSTTGDDRGAGPLVACGG